MTAVPDHPDNKKKVNWNLKPHIPIPDKPDSMTKAERDIAILELRKAGWEPYQIGGVLGLSTKEVRQILRRRLRQAGKILLESSTENIALSAQRHEAFIKALWPKIINGDTRAIETATKVLQRHSELLGLDAPTRVQTTQEITLEVLSDQDLEQRIKELGIQVTPTLPANYTLPGLEHKQPEVIEDAQFEQIPVAPPLSSPEPEPEPSSQELMTVVPTCTVCKQAQATFTCDCKVTFQKDSSVFLCDSCRKDHQCGTLRKLT